MPAASPLSDPGCRSLRGEAAVESIEIPGPVGRLTKRLIPAMPSRSDTRAQCSGTPPPWPPPPLHATQIGSGSLRRVPYIQLSCWSLNFLRPLPPGKANPFAVQWPRQHRRSAALSHMIRSINVIRYNRTKLLR